MARTRSVHAHKKVIDAAVTLFADRGIDATSMDAIAETSGVSKATIYKHWPDKDALAMEVMAHIHGLDEEPPSFNTGDYRRDLISLLAYQPGIDQALKEKMWPHLMAYSARNPAFGDTWRTRVSDPARQRLIAMIKRGQREGLLQKSLDPEVGVALLLGPFIYIHVFIRRSGRKVPKDFEVHIADAFLAAFEAGKIHHAKKIIAIRV
jgi:AcrR family transcriptional regulator